MKKILSLSVLLALLLVSCKPTSTIITSKQKAIALNKYQPLPVEKTKSEPVTVAKSKPEEKRTQQEEIISAPIENGGIDEFDDSNKNSNQTDNADFKIELIESAKENLGSPYAAGGTSKNGFDCSGFVFTLFKSFDRILPRSSHEMADFGRVIAKEEFQKGDLIFFKTNGSSKINHVGIVIESDGDGIKFIHSSTQKGVVISSTNEGYYQKTFVQINRVIE